MLFTALLSVISRIIIYGWTFRHNVHMPEWNPMFSHCISLIPLWSFSIIAEKPPQAQRIIFHRSGGGASKNNCGEHTANKLPIHYSRPLNIKSACWLLQQNIPEINPARQAVVPIAVAQRDSQNRKINPRNGTINWKSRWQLEIIECFNGVFIYGIRYKLSKPRNKIAGGKMSCHGGRQYKWFAELQPCDEQRSQL